MCAFQAIKGSLGSPSGNLELIAGDGKREYIDSTQKCRIAVKNTSLQRADIDVNP